MASTIFGMLHPDANKPAPKPKSINDMFGNFGNFMREFSNFNRRMAGAQNPKAEVERMLANGEMTQEQFNEVAQMADTAFSMMGRR